jgi:DNA primase
MLFPEEPLEELLMVGNFFFPEKGTDARRYLESEKRRVNEEFIRYYDLTYCVNATINRTSFKKRICIPSYFENKLVTIEGRDYTEKQAPKVLYPKGSRLRLFDYDRLDRNKTLYVVEGIMDLPPLFNLGLRNITCIFGGKISYEQQKLLKLFDDIVLIPDGDNPGLELIDSFEAFYGRDYYIAFVPWGKDPGKCTVREIEKIINDKIDATEYYMNESGMKFTFKVKAW